MKSTPFLLSLLFLGFIIATSVCAVVPAFPGAEGFGAQTPGGRGGTVFVVTNLNDSGPGSFRNACEAKGARIVVFAVSGIIDLQMPIAIKEPYITIAGQTAPGEGICLKRFDFEVQTHDVIVRFIRSRPGDIAGKAVDAMDIGRGAHDVIFDHCSANWSVDECLSPSGTIYNVTVQWCLIGEALNKSLHPKGDHGYGSLVRAVGGVSLHHNLWINNVARNPRMGDNYGKGPWPTYDFRNNVIYNWGSICSGMTGDTLSVNYVGNYLRPGPNSSKREPIALTSTSDVSFYLSGNVVDGVVESSNNASNMFSPPDATSKRLLTIVDKPFKVVPVKTTSAIVAYKNVLNAVGAICPSRDTVDARLIEQVIKNKGKIINSQNEVGEWPIYKTCRSVADSDFDGMPDQWESQHGLNPKSTSDAAIISKNGYSNIELYINEIAQKQIDNFLKRPLK